MSKPNCNHTPDNADREPPGRRPSRRGFVIAMAAYGLWLAFLTVLAVIQPPVSPPPARREPSPAAQPTKPPPAETPGTHR